MGADVAGAFFALQTAEFYVELVTMHPKAGGASVFAERANGRPLLSFLAGFAMLSAGITSAAGLALAFARTYMSDIVSVPQIPAALVFS